MFRWILAALGLRAAKRGMFGHNVARGASAAVVPFGGLAGTLFFLFQNRREIGDAYGKYVAPRLAR
jgi:hypothetical protein